MGFCMVISLQHLNSLKTLMNWSSQHPFEVRGYFYHYFTQGNGLFKIKAKMFRVSANFVCQFWKSKVWVFQKLRDFKSLFICSQQRAWFHKLLLRMQNVVHVQHYLISSFNCLKTSTQNGGTLKSLLWMVSPFP